MPSQKLRDRWKTLSVLNPHFFKSANLESVETNKNHKQLSTALNQKGPITWELSGFKHFASE